MPASHLCTDDSPDAARAYLTGLFSDRYPHVIETFASTAPEVVRFVEQRTPLRFTACVNYPDYHPSRPGARRGGRALDILPLHLSHLAPLARNVLRPPGCCRIRWPRPARPPGNTGDALRIAVGLDAEVDNMSGGWWMPMIAIPGETLDGKPYYQSLIRERALPRQILVNVPGRRFVNEALPYNQIGKAMHRLGPDADFPNASAWMVFDEGFRRSFGVPVGRPGPGPVRRG